METLKRCTAITASSGGIDQDCVLAQSDLSYVLKSALNQASDDPSDVNKTATLVRDAMFSNPALLFNPFAKADFKKMLKPGTPDYANTVGSAYLLAFAFQRDNFWTDLSTAIGPSFDDTNPKNTFLAWYAALIKLFQMNLAHAIHHGYGTAVPYTLFETFENAQQYPAVQATLFSGFDSLFPRTLVSNDRFKRNFLGQAPAILLDSAIFDNNGFVAALDDTNFTSNLDPIFFSELTAGQFVPADRIRTYLTTKTVSATAVPQTTSTIAPVTSHTARVRKVTSSEPITVVALKRKWLDALSGHDTVTYSAPKITETFRVRGRDFTLTKPRGLSAGTAVLYNNLIDVLRKYIALNPGIVAPDTRWRTDLSQPADLNGPFRELLAASDLYFGASRFYEEIRHAVRTKISVAVTGSPDRRLRYAELMNSGTRGFDKLVALDTIGFPDNHGMRNKDTGLPQRIFRPEYELPDAVFSDMDLLQKAFGLRSELKPNFHVEELLPVKFGIYKKPGEGPKAKDVEQELCRSYGAYGVLVNREVRHLKKLDADRSPQAESKWRSFMSEATHGACADEYFKSLTEWIEKNGSNGPSGDPKTIVEGFISVKQIAPALKDALIRNRFLVGPDLDTNEEPRGPYMRSQASDGFALQQLKVLLGAASYKDLIDEFVKNKCTQPTAFEIIRYILDATLPNSKTLGLQY